jgi:hypothetical protein
VEPGLQHEGGAEHDDLDGGDNLDARQEAIEPPAGFGRLSRIVLSVAVSQG